MSDQIASQSNETQANEQNQAVQDAFALFGLNTPESEEKPSDGQEKASDEAKTQEGKDESAPATEPKSEPRMIKVKHNKQEIEVDVSDDKLPEYVQKALALDKERERKTEYQKYLDEVAKLQGYKDHEDLIANLEKLKEEAKQREQDQFLELRQQLRQEAENAGLDPEKVEAWLDNHPLLKQAQTALQERERAEQERLEQAQREKFAAQWNELYTAFPELVESSSAFERGEVPDWYTEEMQTMVASGYHPLHAYKLAHMDKIQEQLRKQAEQKAIKEQRLGMRAQVETDAGGELEPEVPAELATAFSLFGLDPKAAKKYVKK